MNSLSVIRKFLETHFKSYRFDPVELECTIAFQGRNLAQYVLEPGEMIQQIFNLNGRKIVATIQNEEITFIQLMDRDSKSILFQTACINPALKKVIQCPQSEISVSFQPNT